MSNPNDKPIPSSRGSGLSGPARAENPIVRRMSESMLRRAKSGELSDERFRLGNYEFRRPDYNQILAWAKALEMEPSELLAVLEEDGPVIDTPFVPIGFTDFRVENGEIVHLVWNSDPLPYENETWETNLNIRQLSLKGLAQTGARRLRIKQISLQLLDLRDYGIVELDLRGAGNLLDLTCLGNQLKELDLRCTPLLMQLECGNNQLVSLDVRHLVDLETLNCSINQIKSIEICNAKLRYLNCSDNSLESLGIAEAPSLELLNCSGNGLAALNLSATPLLESLECSQNNISTLDLSGNPKLRKITCDKFVRLLNCPPGLEVKRVR